MSVRRDLECTQALHVLQRSNNLRLCHPRTCIPAFQRLMSDPRGVRTVPEMHTRPATCKLQRDLDPEPTEADSARGTVTLCFGFGLRTSHIAQLREHACFELGCIRRGIGLLALACPETPAPRYCMQRSSEQCLLSCVRPSRTPEDRSDTLRVG